MKYYIGIDPGLSGAFAVLDVEGDFLGAGRLPVVGKEIDIGEFRLNLAGAMDAICDARDCCVAIEQVHAMPKQGVASMFTFGHACGEILGAIKAWGISCERVQPRKWQGVILAGMTRKDPKQAALSYVKRRYPGANLLATPRSTVPHGGIVDAICLAEYARRLWLGDKVAG